MASKSETGQLRVFFLPFFIAGHMIPMVDEARIFARHGVAVTVVTTAANALIFRNSIGRDVSSGHHHIRIHILQFPSSEVGLSAGVENLNAATSPETRAVIYEAIGKLREPTEELFRQERPDCIVSDMFYFSFCAARTAHESSTGRSGDDVVLLSGLPHRIELLRSQVSDWTKDSPFASFREVLRESEMKSYGVLMNSFDELEPAYVAHCRSTMMMKSWSVGPVSLWLKRDDLPDVGKPIIEDQTCESEILNWLNSKEHNSVLYVSFGSIARFPSSRLKEISHGLEASGHHFIWVVRKRETDDHSEIFPEGFEQRMKENKRGFVVRDWAPQLLILEHPATGAMVTHCGWNSIIEAVAAGKPMITWPLHAEEFYNEKLLTDVLRIGVSLGVREPSFEGWRLGKEVVRREKVEKGVELLMGSGGEAAEMRKRVRKLAEDAKKAVEIGGSSHSNLMALINELKSLKKL